MNKENTCEQNMPWERDDKIFAATLAITIVSVFSLLAKYAPTENMWPIYLAMSIMIGSFTAIAAMEIDKKMQLDRNLRIGVLDTVITIGLVLLIGAAMFATAAIVTLRHPLLLLPVVLIGTFLVMFVFVPKIDDVNAFLMRKITGYNAPH